MNIPPLAQRPALQLVAQAAELMAMAKTASAPEIRQMLVAMAERYRELATQRAAEAALAGDDPGRAELTRSIELLATTIAAAQKPLG